MSLTLRDSLQWGITVLQKKGIKSPRLDSEVLLANTLGLDRLRLLLEHQSVLDNKDLRRFKSLIKRRASKEPVHYIIGEKEFWSLIFKINKDVLIPRPETEFLIEGALEIVEEYGLESLNIKREITILDLGTGCGNIPVALTKELKNCFVYALDQSEKALKVAKENLILHSVQDRTLLIKGDFCKDLGFKKGCFDIIVSNPPYVSVHELKRLSKEVKDFEPIDSLNGGRSGLDYINEIIIKSPYFLKDKGFLLLEIGKDQRDSVQGMIENRGLYANIRVKRDLAGIERVIMAQKVKQ
jgi:release factor glutamine methyltransferase